MIIGKFRENSEEVNMAESAHEIKDKMEEEEKDHNSDILTRFTNFVDNNLRLFRVRIENECFIL